jgi:hypothetical protein
VIGKAERLGSVRFGVTYWFKESDSVSQPLRRGAGVSKSLSTSMLVIAQPLNSNFEALSLLVEPATIGVDERVQCVGESRAIHG